jgi:hypothetical protein
MVKNLRRRMLQARLRLSIQMGSRLGKHSYDMLTKFDSYLANARCGKEWERRDNLKEASQTATLLMYDHPLPKEKPDETLRRNPMVRAVARYMRWAIRNEVLPRSEVSECRDYIEGEVRLIDSFLS